MVNIGEFNTEQHESRDAFDPLPSAWYPMQIVASDTAKTKDEEGGFLKLDIEILENVMPGLKGRKVFDRLNLWNKSEKAVQIANSTLKKICESLGIAGVVTDSSVLEHKPIAVKVKIRPASGDYEASNVVTGYDAFSARFGAGAAAPATQPMQAASGSVVPPGTPQATAPAAAPPAEKTSAAPSSATPPWAK